MNFLVNPNIAKNRTPIEVLQEKPKTINITVVGLISLTLTFIIFPSLYPGMDFLTSILPHYGQK